MTKQEHKLQSMLNYLEVDLKGIKDEKMTKKELNSFLDRFNQSMDFYILEDIISKIKEKRQQENFEDGDDEEIDPLLNKNAKNNKPPKHFIDDEFLFNEDKTDGNSFNDPIDTDINKFLKWLTLILYSGDHTVIVTEDKNGIYIKLVKINKGKK